MWFTTETSCKLCNIRSLSSVYLICSLTIELKEWDTAWCLCYEFLSNNLEAYMIVGLFDRLCSNDHHTPLFGFPRCFEGFGNCLAPGWHDLRKVDDSISYDVIIRIITVTTIIINEFKLELLGPLKAEVHIDTFLEVWIQIIFDVFRPSDFKPLITFLWFLKDNANWIRLWEHVKIF